MADGPGEGHLGAEFELSRLLCTSRAAEEVVAAAARGLRRRGSTPDARNALVHPHNGCTRARAYHAQQAKQRDGRDVGARGGARLSEVLRWVEVDVPSRCGGARPTGRAAGLRAARLEMRTCRKGLYLLAPEVRRKLRRMGWRSSIATRGRDAAGCVGRPESAAAKAFVDVIIESVATAAG